MTHQIFGTAHLRPQFDLGPDLTVEGDPLAVLSHVLGLQPAGYAAEFGVGRGGSLAAITAAAGWEAPDGPALRLPVIGFDSFTGLPADWRPGFPAGRFACRPPAIPNTHLIIGRFEHTLPRWSPPGPLGLVHIDCDLYASTATVLHYLHVFLRPGCYIVFDEFHGYDGAEAHEQRAWAEYCADYRPGYRVIGHGSQQWAIRLT